MKGDDSGVCRLCEGRFGLHAINWACLLLHTQPHCGSECA